MHSRGFVSTPHESLASPLHRVSFLSTNGSWILESPSRLLSSDSTSSHVSSSAASWSFVAGVLPYMLCFLNTLATSNLEMPCPALAGSLVSGTSAYPEVVIPPLRYQHMHPFIVLSGTPPPLRGLLDGFLFVPFVFEVWRRMLLDTCTNGNIEKRTIVCCIAWTVASQL
jgi:hypothetical protein